MTTLAAEHLIGWGTCKAQEIINLDPKVISLIVERPQETPYHVAIQFCLEGGVVRGIVKDAYILELFETIEDSKVPGRIIERKPGKKPRWGYFPKDGHPEVVTKAENRCTSLVNFSKKYSTDAVIF